MPPPPAGAPAQQSCRRGNMACTTHSFSCVCCASLPGTRAAVQGVAGGRLSSGDVFVPSAGSAATEPGHKSSRVMLDAPVAVVAPVGLFNVPAYCNWAPRVRCFFCPIFTGQCVGGSHKCSGVAQRIGARCPDCQLPELFLVSQLCQCRSA